MPEDWRLIEERGTSHSGNLSFQTDTVRFRLEWKPIGKKSPEPLGVILERFVGKMRKSAKGTLKVRKGSVKIHEHNASFVHFITDQKGGLYLWYCKPTGRLFVIELAFGKEGRGSTSVISRIIQSFTCHGLDGRIWSLLGFRFATPESLELDTRRFVVGKGALAFLEKKRSLLTEHRLRVLFEYFSMANVRFEDTYKEPNRWLDEYYLDHLKRRYGKLEFTKTQLGQVKGHKVEVRDGNSSSGLTWRSNAEFIVASWYCPDANRIYATMVTKEITRPIFLKRHLNKEDVKDLFKYIIKSIRCH